MNLAVLYEMTGRYQKETELLTSMESTYSEDYRVYMRYALMYFSVELQKEETERDYSIVIKYYSIAEKYYEGIQNSGASDDNMQYLEELIGELESKGWL